MKLKTIILGVAIFCTSMSVLFFNLSFGQEINTFNTTISAEAGAIVQGYVAEGLVVEKTTLLSNQINVNRPNGEDGCTQSIGSVQSDQISGNVDLVTVVTGSVINICQGL